MQQKTQSFQKSSQIPQASEQNMEDKQEEISGYEVEKKKQSLGANDVLGLEKPLKETRKEVNQATEVYLQVAEDYGLAKTDVLSKNTSVTQGLNQTQRLCFCFKQCNVHHDSEK